MNFDAGLLLSTSGLALFTGVAVKLFVTSWFDNYFIEKRWRDIAVNGLAYVFALIGALIGAFVFAQWFPQNLAWLFIQAVLAAALAVYGYEVIKNLSQFVGHTRSE